MTSIIKIRDKEYKLKYNVRALFIFEQITEHPFELKTTLDNYVFFYALLRANNEDCLSWDEFLDETSDNPDIMKQLLNFLTEYHNSQKVFESDEVDESGQKKS